MRHNLLILLFVVVLSTLGLAACGGGSSSSSSTASTEATSTPAEATQALDLPTSPPTQIPIKTPLAEKPPTGKKVLFLQCELPICQLYTNGMKEATEALGWNFEAQVFKSTEPEKAIQQAIALKPDYIGITGIPPSLLKSQLAAAEKAGIPVLSCGAASPEKPGEQYTVDCGHTDVRDAENALAWITNDSGGSGHILGVTIPQYPVLNSQTEYLESPALNEVCSECTYEQLDTTPEELGAGNLPEKIAGYLQSHPEIDYLYLTFNDLSVGLYPVLQSAGLAEKVKITGGAATNSVIKEIPDQMAAWTVEPVEYSSWVMIDAMARIATGEEITPAYRKSVEANPSWLVDSKEAAESLKETNYEWPGPTDYQGQFKALWKVGG